MEETKTQRKLPILGWAGVGIIAVGRNAIGIVTAGIWNSFGIAALSLLNAMGLVAIGGVNAMGVVAIAGFNATGVIAIGGGRAAARCRCRRPRLLSSVPTPPNT